MNVFIFKWLSNPKTDSSSCPLGETHRIDDHHSTKVATGCSKASWRGSGHGNRTLIISAGRLFSSLPTEPDEIKALVLAIAPPFFEFMGSMLLSGL